MIGNALCKYIFLNDAVTALEEISIDQQDIRKPNMEEIKTSTLLDHTTLSQRFQRRERKKRQREEFRPNRHQIRVYNGNDDGYGSRIEKKHCNSLKERIYSHGARPKNQNGVDNKPFYFQ